MRVLDEHFKRPPKNPTFDDLLNPETLSLVIKDQMQKERDRTMPQVEALLEAGWTFEVVGDWAPEPWQWYWRRPPRRNNSQGMLFRSTSMAFNALMRERGAA